MSMAMIRDLYEYHRWANRKLFDFAAALGEGTCAREVGAHFSHSKVTRMFAHLYGADWVWLSRWKGTSPTTQPGAELPTMALVREKWDALETEQKAFIDGLKDSELGRMVEYKNTEGRALARCCSTSPITQPTTAARSPRWSRCSAARRPIPASTPGS